MRNLTLPKSPLRQLSCALVATVALSCSAGAAHAAPATVAACGNGWAAWEGFKKEFISEGGRVVDGSIASKPTTSEGQAYALFFALVANDRNAFELILKWTEDNLANGDLTVRLPAWIWGKKADDSWGVIDGNPASDADLWIAYALGEAGRLWGVRRYVALSSLLANRILREESADLPGLGPSLLPAPAGFTPGPASWRLNPSYMPLQLMQWFARHCKDPRWEKLLASSRQIIKAASVKGYAPDWIIYDKEQGFQIDRQGSEKGEGSYNAIRVYLWAGMLAENAGDRRALLDTLKPMAQFVQDKGYPPESINVESGVANNAGSSGFSAALLPLLSSGGFSQAYEEQQLRIESKPLKADAYYEQVLGLYAFGWQQQFYRFEASGNLVPRWVWCK